MLAVRSLCVDASLALLRLAAARVTSGEGAPKMEV